MKAITQLLALTTIAEAMTSYPPPVKRREFFKSPLSKKAKKVRAKNKAAKKARKQNRKL